MKWRLTLDLEPYDDKIKIFNMRTREIECALMKAVLYSYPLELKAVLMRGEWVEE